MKPYEMIPNHLCQPAVALQWHLTQLDETRDACWIDLGVVKRHLHITCIFDAVFSSGVLYYSRPAWVPTLQVQNVSFAYRRYERCLHITLQNTNTIQRHRDAGRRLRDTQLNNVDTHVAVGDVLVYDVSLGIASADNTDQATGSHTRATTVAVSQAAGLNNASCLMTPCAIPTADSTASTATTTGQCRLQHLMAPCSQLDAMNQQCLSASCHGLQLLY